MTQVITALTPRFVAQVSDRQLTYRHGDGRETYPADPENKATVVADRLCFSYTGTARIRAMRTDEWLAEAIAPHRDVEEMAADVMRRASADVSDGLTLVAGSWHEPQPGDFRPACLVITNVVRDVHQVPIRPDATAVIERNGETHAFDRWVYEPDPSIAVLMHVAGVALNDEQVKTTLRRARRAYVETADPLALIRVLAERVRLTAEHNRSVGRDLMATYLPRPTPGRAPMLVLGRPLTDMPTALYLPADSDDPIEYMPNYVDAGMVVERGRTVRDRTPPGPNS